MTPYVTAAAEYTEAKEQYEQLARVDDCLTRSERRKKHDAYLRMVRAYTKLQGAR